MDPSKAIASPDIWQTFGLLAAFVATVGVFIYYLIRIDAGRREDDARRDKTLEAIEDKSSRTNLEAARICAESQREATQVNRESMAVLARCTAALERVEARL